MFKIEVVYSNILLTRKKLNFTEWCSFRSY